MSLETMIERIKKEGKNCAGCGNVNLKLTPIVPPTDMVVHNFPKDEMYWCFCLICGHKRIEIDYDLAELNKVK